MPIRHGDYDIKVSTTPDKDEDDGDGRENLVEVRRALTVSPTSGTRGTEVTISGKGFTDGTADIMIGGDYTVTADVDDGAFTTTVDSAVKDNAGKNVFDGATTGEGEDDDRKTEITISDAATDEAPAKTFEIKPSFTFDPESPTPGQDVTINLVDISGEPTSVTFTGAAAIVDIADSDPDDGEDSTRSITSGTLMETRKPPPAGRSRFPVTHGSETFELPLNTTTWMILSPRPSPSGPTT